MAGHQYSELYSMVFLAAFVNGWVSAKTLDLLPKRLNEHVEISDKKCPASLSKIESFRGQQFNVGYIEESLDYSWISKEGRRMYDGPIFQFLQTLQDKTGIIIHKKKARSYDVLSTALVKGETDFSAPFLYYTTERMITLDTTAAVVVGEYCLVMKRAPFLPFGMVLLSPYETSTWATLLLSLGVLTLFWCEVQDYRLVRGRYIKTSSDDRIVHAILDVVQIMLTNSSSRVVQTNAQRVMLSAGLLVVLVLSNAYSGQLLGFLANPPRMKDPQTLQEAAPKVDSVYIIEHLKANVLNANEDGSLTELISKMKPQNFVLDMNVVQRIAKQGKESVFTSTRQLLFVLNYKELMVHGDRTLHSVPECFFTPGHQSFLIRKKSAFYDVLCKMALLAAEGGLFDHWTRSQRHHMDANGVTVPESFSLGEPHPLSVEQLSGPFTVLSIAWGIATVIFILERSTAYILRIVRERTRSNISSCECE